MSSVGELAKRFNADGGGGIAIGRGTRPPAPPKPRPTSSHFGGNTTSNGPTSNHLATHLAARNSNNISSSNQRNSHQVQQQDVYDNELPSEQPSPPVSNSRPFQQPAFSPPAPPQRNPPARNTTPAWNSQPSSIPPPVPQTARPESSSIESPTRPNFASHIGNNHVSRGNAEDHATSVEYSTAGKGLSYELCTDLQQNFQGMPDYVSTVFIKCKYL